jgi:hypothetical protein
LKKLELLGGERWVVNIKNTDLEPEMGAFTIAEMGWERTTNIFGSLESVILRR